MSFIEYPVRLKAGAPPEHCVGSIRCFRSRLLRDVVDTIWDLDIPNSNAASALIVEYPPNTSLLLMAQYRAPVVVRQHDQDLPNKCATQIRASSVTLRPTGALGFVIVSLRSESASRIVDAPLGQFANANIHLANVFGRGDVSMCDEMLAEALDSSERIATIESFLLRRLRPKRDDVASRAASLLRNDPTLPLQQIASMLSVSTRHLARAFGVSFGMNPKKFARLARIEKAVAGRRNGLQWSEVACACGFADQAHLVREFKEIVGEVPTKFFAQEACANIGKMTEANFVIKSVMEEAHW
jgi:AraC-like DNA-binding protein